MSAENYAVCPNCWEKAKADRAAKEERARSLYGQIPEADYILMMREFHKELDPEDFRILEERYEQGFHELKFLETGEREYFCEYWGGCEKCGLEHEYEHKSAYGSSEEENDASDT